MQLLPILFYPGKLHTRAVCMLFALLFFSILPGFAQMAPEPAFIPNMGQLRDTEGRVADEVIATFQQADRIAYVTTDGLVYRLRIDGEQETGDRHPQVQIQAEGALITPSQVTFEQGVNGVYQYYVADSDAPILAYPATQLTVHDLYPGIDWTLTATAQGIKYHFVVHPQADPQHIVLQYTSVDGIALGDDGALLIHTIAGDITEPAPMSFVNDVPLHSAFRVLTSEGDRMRVGFSIDAYDKQQTLVIDPALWWCTFYGGLYNEEFTHLTSDPSGNIIAVGFTESANFPTYNAGTYFQGTKSVDEDAVIVKFSASGERLWSTFYGGNAEDYAHGVATDASGNILVTGETVSSNFPVLNAGTYYQGSLHGDEDVFILKFNSAGTRLWATYYGGDNKEAGYAIRADASGNIFVTGYTKSDDFPKLNAGTYYQASLAGAEDAFMLKFNNAGTRLWATYYGGNAFDAGHAIAIDSDNEVFVTGSTKSTTFPVYDAGTFYQGTMAGDTDAYVIKFSNTGARLWASYYGGPDAEYGMSVVTDAFDDVYFGGYTRSTGLFTYAPDLSWYWQPVNAGGTDLYILRVTNDGTLAWSTLYGGTGNEYMDTRDALAINGCNDLYVSQTSWSTDMPIYDAGCGSYYDVVNDGNGDIFLTRFTDAGVITWATYYGYEDEDILTCIETPAFEGNTLFMTGVYHEYDPGEAVPLMNPGGGAYYDGTHNGDDETFVAKFNPVPLNLDLTFSNLCYCLDSATVTPSCGVAPYTYLWTDGQTDSIATGLCAGLWEVIVSDADCNVDTVSFVIDCILPTELIEFSGVSQNGMNLLTWEVPDVHASTSYQVFRYQSGDAVNIFTTAADQGSVYQCTDMSYADSTMYYILTGYDGNGQALFSETISIEPAADDDALRISYPEYERAALHLKGVHDEQVTAYVLDLAGHVVEQYPWSLHDGDNTMYFEHPDLPKGNYIVTIAGLSVHASAIFHHR